MLTLRADFYDRPLRHRAIGELLRRGTEVITPMSPDEVERAIDGPAEQVGVPFEPGLVAEIVADVAERPGALPLLQYALTELFDAAARTVIELVRLPRPGRSRRRPGPPRGGPVRRARRRRRRRRPARCCCGWSSLGEGTEDVRRRVLRLELARSASRTSTRCSTPSVATAC